MTVDVTVADGVAVVAFASPETANAWTLEMQRSYSAALRRCADDVSVRAVVVTGHGRHFCAGADMSLLEDLRRGQQPPAELQPERFLEVIDFPKPLVAAVNGAAAGMGLVHALLCDVRIVSERASMTAVFPRMGLVAEHGTSWFLPQLIGRGAALELLMTGRSVSAEEAVRTGLALRAVPPDELLDTAIQYARAASTLSEWSRVRRFAANDPGAFPAL